jgi:hypothetical protein
LTDCKVKKWNHTAFAKTGTKGKIRKRKARELDKDVDEEDAVEQFTTPIK